MCMDSPALPIWPSPASVLLLMPKGKAIFHFSCLIGAPFTASPPFMSTTASVGEASGLPGQPRCATQQRRQTLSGITVSDDTKVLIVPALIYTSVRWAKFSSYISVFGSYCSPSACTRSTDSEHHLSAATCGYHDAGTLSGWQTRVLGWFYCNNEPDRGRWCLG